MRSFVGHVTRGENLNLATTEGKGTGSARGEKIKETQERRKGESRRTRRRCTIRLGPKGAGKRAFEKTAR